MEITCVDTVNIAIKQESGEVNSACPYLSTIKTEEDNLKSIEFETVFLNNVKTESDSSGEDRDNGNSKVRIENGGILDKEKGKHIENESKNHIKLEEHERQWKEEELASDVHKEQIEREAQVNHLLDCEKIEVEKHELPENCIVVPQNSENNLSNKRKSIETKDLSSNDAVDNKKRTRKLKRKPADDEFYTCQHCHKNYKRKADLTVHINIKHKGDVKNVLHKCKHCEYQSPYLQHINRHEKEKHASDKSFSCSKCSYVTTRNSSLKLHMNTHLQSNMYKCKFCDYVTKLSYVLAAHISNKHSEMK